MFDKILIANRAEIACRIIATCRRLAVATVAVYSQADADARHVRLADEAYCIGPAAARDSYLNIDRLIGAARRSGAQAIHPGYGFLSENPQFAERTVEAGLVFIGPSAAAMRAMSSKATARSLMQRVGVPVLPGYQGEQQEPAYLREQAARVGFPVLIKAVAGGGGKGMRLVAAAGEFDAALLACQREAANSFGDARVLLEKYLAEPRHIEVQVFGDTHGNVVHLFERDCSAQRRHQKVIEESPAASLSDTRRQALTAAACEAARAVGYSGAGTVEFLFDRAGEFYFIEMNTRIQVEHPVTEMITGIDLVEWQLRVAAGATLPLSQSAIQRSGHAIEARLYAEVPETGFLPSSGRLRRFGLPPATPALRLETGMETGDWVGTDYDPMLAKVIALADTRAEARVALERALAQVRIGGVGNNLWFLRRLLASEAFAAGAIDTGWIERHLSELLRPPRPDESIETLLLAAAALWLLEQERRAASGPAERPVMPSPWQSADGWRLSGAYLRRLRYQRPLAQGFGSPASQSPTQRADANAAALPEVEIEYRVGERLLRIGRERGSGSLRALDGDDFELRFADRTERLQIIDEGAGELSIWRGLDWYRVRRQEALARIEGEQQPEASLAAPMPGRIIAQLVAVGETVAKGAPLLIIEAMKMEHTLCAPTAGIVRAYHAAVGDQIQEGSQLIDFEAQR